MTDRRTSRLNEQLKREISGILNTRVRDPRVGRVLVTEVRVTSDLWLARIFVRPLDEGKEAEDTMKGLEAAAAFIRKELGKDLHIRRVPELRFVQDTTLDSALRIEEVLKEVLPEGEAGDGDSDAPDGADEEGMDGATPEDSPA
jgi:ribosome-binding factor A